MSSYEFHDKAVESMFLNHGVDVYPTQVATISVADELRAENVQLRREIAVLWQCVRVLAREIEQ